MVVEYQRRKWFANWRKNYLIRANQNYLMPPHEEKISHLQKSQRIISNLSKPPRYSRTIKPPGYKTVNFLANPVIEQSESFVSQDDFPQENFQANNIPTLDLASHEHNQQSILLSQLKYYHKLPHMISEELNSQNLSVAQKVHLLSEKINQQLSARSKNGEGFDGRPDLSASMPFQNLRHPDPETVDDSREGLAYDLKGDAKNETQQINYKGFRIIREDISSPVTPPTEELHMVTSSCNKNTSRLIQH